MYSRLHPTAPTVRDHGGAEPGGRAGDVRFSGSLRDKDSPGVGSGFPVSKNRKNPCAGSRRVPWASARMRENLGAPKFRRTGQTKCYPH